MGPDKHPFRIAFEYKKANYTLDIINMFADHLKIKAQNVDEYQLNTSYKISKNIFLFANYKFSHAVFKESSAYDLEKNVLTYNRYNAGLGYLFGSLGIRVSGGHRDYHTFLETDTEFYFRKQLESTFGQWAIDYQFSTSFFFDIELFLENEYYIPSTFGDFEIEQGYVRHWGGRLVFRGRLRYGLGFTQSHHNIKMVHNFFGLKNEMNNRLESSQISFFMGYHF